MDSQTFNDIVERQLAQIKEVLVKKGVEYATEDRLHNFKVAADLQGETPRQALMGMMAKHTVSVFDMGKSADDFSMAQWDEKITDHLNYLILLKAIVMEEVMDRKCDSNSINTPMSRTEVAELLERLQSPPHIIPYGT